MITTYACIILKTFPENLRRLLSALNGQQMMLVVLMTLALTQAYLHRSFFHEQALRVHQVKGSTAQT